MGLFSFFRSEKKTTATIAKERLQILIAHERMDRNSPDFLPDLRRDLMDVIKKYVAIEEESVDVKLDRHKGYDTLELNITLPDN